VCVKQWCSLRETIINHHHHHHHHRSGPPSGCNQPPWAPGRPAQPYFRAYGAAWGGVPCARNRAIFAPRPLGRLEPPEGAEAPVSTPNGHRMATTAGPRHGGGAARRVRVRTGTLALCRRSVAWVRGDRGPGYGRRPKMIANPNSAKNPRTNRLQGGFWPPRSARVARSIIAAGGWTIYHDGTAGRAAPGKKKRKKFRASDILTIFSNLGG
jgi:hypothetical protein